MLVNVFQETLLFIVLGGSLIFVWACLHLKPTRREVIFCQMDVSNTLSKLGDVIRVRSTYWLGCLLVVGKSCFFPFFQ